MRLRPSIIGGCAAVLLSAGMLHAAASDMADAAMQKDKPSVRSLLAKKADVNAPQADGTTALHWAVRWDDSETADLLIRAGATVGARNRNGATPLYLAAVNGSAPMIEKLLKAGANPNESVLSHQETPLMIAARTGKTEAVKVLLDHGADIDAKENLRDTTALMWAAEQNHPDVIQLLAAKGANLSARSKVNAPQAGRRGGGGGGGGGGGNGGQQNAQAAGQRGVDGQQTQQVQGGGNTTPPLAGTTGGLTSLVFAAREGAIDAVKVLLAAGADPNQTTADGSTPMLVAVQNGHYNVASLLLGQRANPDLSNEKGWNPLYLAVKNRNLETGTIPVPNEDLALDFIKLLLQNGANPNLRVKANTEIRNGQRATWLQEAGATPFLRAAVCGDVTVMRLLIEHGADPSITTDDKTTPLMAAAGVGYTEGFIHDRSESETLEAMKLLLDLGADVNAANDGGLTALHGAAHKAVLSPIQLLVDRGANLAAKDKGSKAYGANTEGLTALDWAEGVVIGVQSAIYHAEAVDLITKLMKEKGIPIEGNTQATRTKGGNAAVGNTSVNRR